MIAESRAIATGMLLTLVCHMSPAVARSSPGTADHPWNPEHIDHLPDRSQERHQPPLRAVVAGGTLLRDLFRKLPLLEPAF
jgi:hypothetical protein